MIAMHIDETGPAPIPISTCECQIIFSIGFVLCHSKSTSLRSIFLCSPAISTLAQEKQQCFSCRMVFKCLHYTLCSIDAIGKEKRRKNRWHKATEWVITFFYRCIIAYLVSSGLFSASLPSFGVRLFYHYFTLHIDHTLDGHARSQFTRNLHFLVSEFHSRITTIISTRMQYRFQTVSTLNDKWKMPRFSTGNGNDGILAGQFHIFTKVL